MVESINPPGWILLVLWPFKGESCYPQIVGDLNEEFHLLGGFSKSWIHGIPLGNDSNNYSSLVLPFYLPFIT
jgi:hypothetical protein